MGKNQGEKVKGNFFSKFIGKFRHGLVLQAARDKLAGIGIEITPYYWVREGNNDSAIPEITGSLSDYSVVFLDASDLKMIGESMRGFNKEALLSDLEAGHLCLGLKKENEIASFMWINMKEVSFRPALKPLNKDEAYLTSMYTVEAFRGKNLAPYLRYRSYDILKEMGRDKIYSVSEYFNKSALRYKEKLKADNIKLILYIRLFRRFEHSFTLRSFKK